MDAYMYGTCKSQKIKTRTVHVLARLGVVLSWLSIIWLLGPTLQGQDYFDTGQHACMLVQESNHISFLTRKGR